MIFAAKYDEDMKTTQRNDNPPLSLEIGEDLNKRLDVAFYFAIVGAVAGLCSAAATFKVSLIKCKQTAAAAMTSYILNLLHTSLHIVKYSFEILRFDVIC